jgi:Family of unknown function (DUF6169)
LTPYPFTTLSDLSFEFETSQGIFYYAYFIEYGFMFHDYPELSKNIYSFNLDVISGDWKISASDDRIGFTVIEIFRLFFSSKENIAVYVCDSSDDRHLSRKRKFDFWFWKFNDGEILKEDGLAVIEGTQVYNSILIHKENNRAAEIFQAFRSLNEKASDKS